MSDDTAYGAVQYQHNYPDGIERHYWNVCRNRLIYGTLARRTGDTILDIGAGRGLVVDYLRRRGLRCWGCDTGNAAPITPAVAPYLLTRQDAFELDAERRDSIDTLLLLDVLEHLPDPVAFLRRCREAFVNARHATITLPARRELWSNYDEYYGHYTRYDTASVRALLDDAGARAEDVGYFFHSLYAPARALAMLGVPRQTRMRAPRRGLASSLHALVGHALRLESTLVPGWVPGSSIYAVASL